MIPAIQNSHQSFGSKKIHTFGAAMERVYNKAQRSGFSVPDMFTVSAKMRDGIEAHALVSFNYGQFGGMHMLKGFENYKREFCRTVVKKVNSAK